MDKDSLADQILLAVKNVMGEGPIKLHEPTFEGNEIRYLEECINSTYVSSIGKFVDQFERDLSDFTGAKHVVSVVNGTAALHLSIAVAGIKPGDEVLVQGLTFVATANAISYCGATPHFVDIEEENLGVDPVKLRNYLEEISVLSNGLSINRLTGCQIKALIVMHTFGHPSKIEELTEICKEYNLILIEDAAESIGSFYMGKHTGTFGVLGTLSFNGNKTITTGGGGAILTNNDNLAKQAKHLSTTAKIAHKWEFKHDLIGYNYRMPNLNAALGCAQLEDLPRKIEKKRKLYELYYAEFSSIAGVKLFKEPEKCQSNYWLQTLKLDSANEPLRDKILEKMNDSGLMSRPAWNLINSLTPYKMNPAMKLDTANYLFNSLINIPSNLRKNKN